MEKKSVDPETSEKAPDAETAAKEENEEEETKKECEKAGSEVQVLFAKVGEIWYDRRSAGELLLWGALQLAESLGLQGGILENAEINLLDPEEAIGPRIMGMINSSGRRGYASKNEVRVLRVVTNYLWKIVLLRFDGDYLPSFERILLKVNLSKNVTQAAWFDVLNAALVYKIRVYHANSY